MPKTRKNYIRTGHYQTDYRTGQMKWVPKPRTPKKKNLSLPMLTAFRKNGKRVKSNTTLKMSLKSLRRLVSAARSGRTASVKVRGR